MSHQHPAVRTGVYMNTNARTAIVVRVREGTVYYLTMTQTKPVHHSMGNGLPPSTVWEVVSQRVDLSTCSEKRFLEQYITHMPNYPLRRAAIGYARSGLEITEQAEKVLRLLLANTKAAA